MDWSTISPFFNTLADVAITAGIGIGSILLKQYTGVQISDANEAAIRRAATTEAGKLLSTGTAITPATVATGASKVIADLPAEVKSEGYTHTDVADMIVGAASIAVPPLAAIAPALNVIAGAVLNNK
jgi:hypothetical protein